LALGEEPLLRRLVALRPLLGLEPLLRLLPALLAGLELGELGRELRAPLRRAREPLGDLRLLAHPRDPPVRPLLELGLVGLARGGGKRGGGRRAMGESARALDRRSTDFDRERGREPRALEPERLEAPLALEELLGRRAQPVEDHLLELEELLVELGDALAGLLVLEDPVQPVVLLHPEERGHDERSVVGDREAAAQALLVLAARAAP